MKYNKVLIVGGTGFLGASVASYLISNGAQVRIMSRGHASPVVGIPCDVEHYVGDFGNSGDVKEALSGVDCVLHFASTTNPKTSESDIMFDIRSNLQSTITLLDACVKAKVKHFVYCSSGGTVYGECESLPVSEKSVCFPISSYGIVKFTIENYIKYFYHRYQIKYSILRLSNPYGIGQLPFSGQGVIGIFLHKILRGEKIQIFGDGQTVRDYIYVKDFCDLCYRVLKSTKHYNKIINVGSGTGTSLNEVVNAVEMALGVKADIEYMPSRNFDVPAIYLDINKAKELYGWEPQTHLYDGVKQTAEWLQSVTSKGGVSCVK